MLILTIRTGQFNPDTLISAIFSIFCHICGTWGDILKFVEFITWRSMVQIQPPLPSYFVIFPLVFQFSLMEGRRSWDCLS